MAGEGATGTSSVAAGSVLDDIAVVEAAVAVDGSPALLPADAYCWGPDPPTGMVSSGGGTTLGAEGEEALADKDGLRPVDMMITLVEKRGYTYLEPWTVQ
jgi:hypothetical protein